MAPLWEKLLFSLNAAMPATTAATVISDASFCPRSRAAGWAAWVRVDGKAEAIKGMGHIRRARVQSSTDAEVWAAIHGAELAIAAGASHALILSDCTAVVQMSHPAWRDFAAQHRLVEFKARHVKGHDGGRDPLSWCNNWCDTWAKREMRAKRQMWRMG